MTNRGRRRADRTEPRCYGRIDDEVDAAGLRDFLEKEVTGWGYNLISQAVEVMDLVARGLDLKGSEPGLQRLIVEVNRAIRKIAATTCPALELELGFDTVETHVGSCLDCQLLVKDESFLSSRTPAVFRLLMEICEEQISRDEVLRAAMRREAIERTAEAGCALGHNAQQCIEELTCILAARERLRHEMRTQPALVTISDEFQLKCRGLHSEFERFQERWAGKWNPLILAPS